MWIPVSKVAEGLQLQARAVKNRAQRRGIAVQWIGSIPCVAKKDLKALAKDLRFVTPMEDAEQIRKERAAGEALKSIAARWGISESAVCRITTGSRRKA